MSLDRQSHDLLERFDHLSAVCHVSITGGPGIWRIVVERRGSAEAIESDGLDFLDAIVDALKKAEAAGFCPPAA